MRRRSYLTVCALVLAAIGLGLLFERWQAANSSPGPAESDVLILPARAGESTLVGYRHDGPPPWPAGNCFSLSPDPTDPHALRLQVANMHAENFGRIVRNLGLETVEVRRVGDRHCLITDARIPRDWLLANPCRTCTPPALQHQMVEEYPERFRPK